ncbi:MAG: hypothetical protein ACI4KD_04135 [Oscillospiraceae bacterium]
MNKLANALKYFYYGLQFSVGIITPFIVCILLADYLKTKFSLGDWITIVAIILAFSLAAADAVSLARVFIKMMDNKKGDKNIEQNDKK